MSFHDRVFSFFVYFLVLIAMKSACADKSNNEIQSAEKVMFSVQVVIQDGKKRTFLHGAKVSIQLLDHGTAKGAPIVKKTGNGGLANMGLLFPSSRVGNYLIRVSHDRCGLVEKRNYSLENYKRPQTLSIAYDGPCSSSGGKEEGYSNKQKINRY